MAIIEQQDRRAVPCAEGIEQGSERPLEPALHGGMLDPLGVGEEAIEGRQHGPQLRRPGREGVGERSRVRLVLVLGRGIEDRRGEALEHREGPRRLELVCLRPEDPVAALLGAESGLIEDP